MDGRVRRPKKVQVEFATAKGKIKKKTFSGWEARIFQHEFDHLNGVVYVDRVEPEGEGEGYRDALEELRRTYDGEEDAVTEIGL